MTYAISEIVAGGLEAAAAEMCASLIRTAYSPNVKERADCSTSICDIAGRTLALASHSPAHLGSTLLLVPALLKRFPKETLRPGDVFFANDPYIVGVTHLNDCTAAAPIFYNDRPVSFAAAIAHHSDVGGRVPGSESGDSTSLFQEGIRLPPVKLFEAGRRRDDLWELFLLNSRTPHFSEGDLFAQTAALVRGTERLLALFDRYGEAQILAAITEMIEATERRSRNRIREVLSPGAYTAEDWLDEDGVSDEPVRLAATVTIKPDRVLFDFSNCSPQLGSGKNVPLTHTMATIYYCLKTVIDPALPINEGLFSTVEVEAPKGSVVNPEPPAGVSSRNLTSMILADVILDALGQAAPGRSMAASGPYQGIILSGWNAARDRFFVDYENFAGGTGALADGDGMDGTQVHMTNTSNLPIEVIEAEFPIQIERYALIPDTGGAGQYRGGLGVCREIGIDAERASLAIRSARQRYPAKGRNGGGPGSKGSCVLIAANGERRRLPSTASELTLRPGDILQISTPGGGGYGDPRSRGRDRVARDLLEGKISTAAAQAEYGSELAAENEPRRGVDRA